ncbi:uncharacterized protein [Argopecten irradians]|uniref:uncharacterized protein n=1 Tax=Argopecten irradians TaxID=31199 RepID=UPI003722FEE0
MTTGRQLQGTKLAVVWVLICVICAIAADDLCSEYLISGWNGLTDERITYLKPYGSTSVPEEAPNLRLHADVAWTTDIYEDHYLLQINFTTPKTLHTIVVLSVPNYIYMYRFIPLTGTWTTDWLSPHQVRFYM